MTAVVIFNDGSEIRFEGLTFEGIAELGVLLLNDAEFNSIRVESE